MKKHSRLESTTLVILLVAMAIQLGKHFWPGYSLIYGVRVDYLSPTLYLFDLIAVFSIFVNKRDLSRAKIVLRPLTLILFLNILTSLAPQITLIYSLRILLYTSAIISLPLSKYRPLVVKTIITTMLATVIIATIQVAKGASIGGILYWLGERNLSLSLPAVAKTQLNGVVLLRAYSTFSHPNILAGWLTLLFFTVSKLTSEKSKTTQAYILALLGAFLAQSRIAIIVLALWGIAKNRKNLPKLLVLVVVVFIINSGSWDRSFTERIELQRTSWLIMQEHPLFGSGLNASISQYLGVSPSLRILQPDHNIATLLLSQGGLFLLLVIIKYLPKLKKFKTTPELYLILLLAISDHYLVTSPQGIFALLLFLRASYV